MAQGDIDIPDKLWKTADFIVVFALTQTMAYILILPNNELNQQIRKEYVAWTVFALTAIACVGYNLVVWWCHNTSIKWYESANLDSEQLDNYKRISLKFTKLRSIALIIYWPIVALPAIGLCYKKEISMFFKWFI